MNTSLLLLFIPTMFFISITPGMCMTLAMTLGVTVGVRRTFWMMWGEVIGVALVAGLAAVGVAAMMNQYPRVFEVFKYCGGAYLGWLGIQMWLSRGSMSLDLENIKSRQATPPLTLAVQGFVTAIANPKGWAFMISLLPPFLGATDPLGMQLVALLGIIVVSELICMTLYATGGRSLRHFLEKSGNVRLINRVAGTLMIGVGVWLAST
ncbi:MAG: LysE family translocator [Rhodospirillales bacterium]|nr:LysE family translocator [Rhodospirillales bacterium]